MRAGAGPNGAPGGQIAHIDFAHIGYPGNQIGGGAVKCNVTAIRRDFGRLGTAGQEDIGGWADTNERCRLRLQVANKDVRNAIGVSRHEVAGGADKRDVTPIRRHG